MAGNDQDASSRLPPLRGRGAGVNPANRFESLRLTVLGEELDRAAVEHPGGTQVRTEAIDDATKSIINRVDSPDLNFNWTLNPYRGCEHGCVYCYARPTHENLGFSCGVDFETRIMVKRDAATLLRRELAQRRGWRGEPIVMAGVTDCYQPLERELCITRQCLEVMVEARQPVSIITKNRLVLRDIDLLRELAVHRCVSVSLSVTTLDNDLARTLEPRASAPAARLDAIAKLREAGVPAMAMVAPVIPGLNDVEIPRILEAVSKAGAITAAWVMLRLPWQVKEIFLEWVAREYPDRLGRIEHAIREMRGGELNQSQWRTRMRGEGPLAEQIKQTFNVFKRRYGLDRSMPELDSSGFRRPEVGGQLGLF